MKKYIINRSLITQKLDNKIVLFDDKKSILHTFNETASYIFNKLKSGWEIKRIIKRMSIKYQVSEKRLVKDVDFIIKVFLKKKIISHLLRKS